MSQARDWVRTLATHSPKYEWLLENGRDWEYDPERSLPADVERGEWRNCYENAATSVLIGPGSDRYRYVEGVAYCGTIPADHAWLVDEEGNVIDPTWVHDGTCGFCLGTGETVVECDCVVAAEDAEYGIDCYESEGHGEEPCEWCGGTGDDPNPRDSSVREYFGVVIPAAELRAHVLQTGTWGCLSDPEWYERLGIL